MILRTRCKVCEFHIQSPLLMTNARQWNHTHDDIRIHQIILYPTLTERSPGRYIQIGSLPDGLTL